MEILVVEDNLLVGDLIRLAVEDADFNVVGPVATLEDGIRMASGPGLDGALLDIKLGGRQSFPLARVLRSQGVPFIFVSAYDRSVLPEDLREEKLVSKPIFADELTRIAIDKFANGKVAEGKAAAGLARAEKLKLRIAEGERKLQTQKRRVERLQFDGHDHRTLHAACDLLEQMTISLDISRDALRILETLRARSVGPMIALPISDEMIDLKDARSVQQWASHFGITPKHLVEVVEESGSTARLVAKALQQEITKGPSRKSNR